MIIIKAPLRISLGGGGTDLYNWYTKHESFLITATINKFIYVTVNKRDLTKDILLSYSKLENVKKTNDIKHTIIKYILKKHKIENSIEIHTISEVPSNSGLGSSGAVAAALIKSLNLKMPKNKIAEAACKVEFDLNNKNSGKQDQYASVYGGINAIKIKKNGKTTVKKLNLSKKEILKLQKNIKIIFTKKQRETKNVISKQSKEFQKKNKEKIMFKIQKIGEKTYQSFLRGDIDNFGTLLDEHWKAKRSFGEFMSSTSIDNLYNNLKNNGATGGKIIGAGGGGFLMMYVPKKNHKKFENYLKRKKYKKLDWKFYDKGIEKV